MARIESKEYNQAQLNNIEKLNGDYFLKILLANSNGDFISDKSPVLTGQPNLRQEADTTDGTVIYFGSAELTSETSDGVWKIQKIIISGSDISVTWADGNSNFDNIYDNRTSLSYS
jgi:hypothetical protein